MKVKLSAVLRVWICLGVVLLFQACTSERVPITIYTIGDSTMADKKPEVYPETGWGQVLEDYFDETVSVENHAKNGRSSKSFIDEGRWQVVLDSLETGDVVFIQFGHNDQKQYDSTRYTTPFGTYINNLEMFVMDSRAKGATPILFTSIVRRKFGADGSLLDTHGDYPAAVRLLAERTEVKLIDLQKITEERISSMGDEASKEMYVWAAPSENYPEGRKDDTHLSEKGAHHIAKRVLEECVDKDILFANRIQF
jgi:lysophospholipase L1-like esterase